MSPDLSLNLGTSKDFTTSLLYAQWSSVRQLEAKLILIMVIQKIIKEMTTVLKEM